MVALFMSKGRPRVGLALDLKFKIAIIAWSAFI